VMQHGGSGGPDAAASDREDAGARDDQAGRLRGVR
jgi:hypothetical protein